MTITDATQDVTAAPELRRQARSRAQPVIDWLTDMGLRRSRITTLHDGFLRQLTNIGIPVDRSTLHLPQLHPQLRAVTVLWEAEAGGAMEIPRAHGIEQTDFFLASPVHLVHQGGPLIRRRLERADCPLDFPIVKDLKEGGYSDYTARPMPFSNKQINTVTLASKQDGGFSDLDIATVDACLPAFSTVLELRNVYRTARNLLQTYIGPRSSDRVLSGTVQRGEVERINAVLWTCDLRDFTSLSDTLPMEEVILLLDDYFEIMAQPIAANGGEILKFIGDAILAIFPIEEQQEGDACRACEAAMQAAQSALNAAMAVQPQRRAESKPEFRCGVALHVGDVMYGNVGAVDRLDFTVIGPAVNLVCRIEDLNRGLEMPLVYSADFARLWAGESRSLGFHDLKGVREAKEVFTLDTSRLAGTGR
ncbi:adenylate/guanylate cyclase domain-containing protein [Pelagibius litoralis]|uniref:Adenylate/guanylate cyclase domain-containing protein n=1 Tax=Pelagibius litoralis TaxID=374515 RepID=A0A967C1P1_9PROT|nr:adenylate/guanylate cyclase domain-containing protein [Pelagibius litoralis]NIA67561.1 adenylate/guanylate cyclase domain-containing protein [Pelagibius litoralis]